MGKQQVYALHLICAPGQVDKLSAELWEAGTQGIEEIEEGETAVRLIAHFTTNESRGELLVKFPLYSPEWRNAEATDWVERTRAAWPGRSVGRRIFLAPPWNRAPTPPGRVRVIHNPGLACGTGEHPCSQLALLALEECVTPGSSVVDIGTGSGILAIAASLLGAGFVVGVDTDETALTAARENFELNKLLPNLTASSADCIRHECADVVVANINASVLLSILDELIRITKPGGWLILTGFAGPELGAMQQYVQDGAVLSLGEWRLCKLRTPSID